MKRHTWIASLAGASLLVTSVPLAWAAPNPATTSSANTHSVTVNLAGKKLITTSFTVATDPNSGHPTSWISAMTVEGILRQIGIDAHFVPGVNQLVMNMPLGYIVPKSLQVPYHATTPGHFVMFVNAKSVAYPPMLGTGPNMDLPVWYVMKTLRAIGVSTHWTGSTWNIAGRVQVPQQTEMGGEVSKTFQLTLSNKPAGLGSVPTPPVPPESPVTVQLPMNSLLKAANKPLSQAAEAMPMNAYVQTGRATYIVDKSISSVENWFDLAYTAQGFPPSGTGWSGNLKTGEYVESQSFAPYKQAPGQDEHITMSYEALGANQTKVEYWVYDTVTPPRPTSSQLAANATSMTVTTTSGNQSGSAGTSISGASAGAATGTTTGTGSQSSGAVQTTTTTVTNGIAIQNVIKAINALDTIDPPGVNPGGPMIRTITAATLTFTYPDGHTATVKASKLDAMYGDVIVDNIPLKDPKGTVWAAMEQAHMIAINPNMRFPVVINVGLQYQSCNCLRTSQR
ncbi:hypothetical protein [Alicyclobacillus ferrooxydans]|uniref:Copper amine oxidase-like N-terminal domain-containing protein n=1 Tax=Alicyclobacillus ferrooxydans TaxID=471514 RepID=A0A0P9D600_9BACL|nr:hypothetical protein [Alicyclobacillus ferrooxydans]KPV44830.1 hypothetical protein AN477_05290 [Alicyclobacillus ferrooxydans]